MRRVNYADLRSTSAFGYILSVVCFIWTVETELAWHVFHGLPAVDYPGFPILTFCLSIEASLAASFIMVQQKKQAVKDEIWREEDSRAKKAQLDAIEKNTAYTMHSMEAQQAILKAVLKAEGVDIDEALSIN